MGWSPVVPVGIKDAEVNEPPRLLAQTGLDRPIPLHMIEEIVEVLDLEDEFQTEPEWAGPTKWMVDAEIRNWLQRDSCVVAAQFAVVLVAAGIDGEAEHVGVESC